MILYFSGTGNSEYVAKRISKETEEKVINLFEKIRTSDFSELHSDRPWIVVAPTYGWRIPRILQEWLEKTILSGSKEIYFVMTCGGDIGNAGKYLRKLCVAKDMNFLGCFSVLMPENYIALFTTPTKEAALEIINEAEDDIDKAADLIKRGNVFPLPSLTVKGKLNSGIVNNLYYPLLVHGRKFYAEDTCVSCGKCADLCPLNNIHMEKGKPVWGKECTHCMACICHCPKEAIEYGKHSKGLPRYVCPKSLLAAHR